MTAGRSRRSSTAEEADDALIRHPVSFVFHLSRSKSQRSNRFEMRFRTSHSENGLMLWLSRGPSLQADYLAVALVHSHLELSFNLGKQTAFLTARSTVPFFL